MKDEGNVIHVYIYTYIYINKYIYIYTYINKYIYIYIYILMYIQELCATYKYIHGMCDIIHHMQPPRAQCATRCTATSGAPAGGAHQNAGGRLYHLEGLGFRCWGMSENAGLNHENGGLTIKMGV